MRPTDADIPAIAVFAKAPIPGQAKTRLIPALGAAGAARLQARLLWRTLETARAARLGGVSLWCHPDCGHPDFAACRAAFGTELFEQRGADLGERMLSAFAALCPSGPVLLIGTDCPALSANALRLAADTLRAGREAVFLPAEDGGYALVGLRQPHPLLFGAMPWGTGQVMAETRARLARLRWRWAEPLRVWDVDHPEDLLRLRTSGLLQSNELEEIGI